MASKAANLAISIRGSRGFGIGGATNVAIERNSDKGAQIGNANGNAPNSKGHVFARLNCGNNFRNRRTRISFSVEA